MNYDCLKLMLVTNKRNASFEDYMRFLEVCVKSGISSIQLREKDLSHSDALLFGKYLKSLRIPIIVNDDLDLCMKLDADGLHLGQGDGDVANARAILGQDKVIGLSVNTVEQIHVANSLPLNYIGVGAIFQTNSKKDAQTIWGIDGLRKAVAISKHKVIAIGGINERNAVDVMKAGAFGIAAIEAFHASQDPAPAIKNLYSAIGLISEEVLL